MYGASSSIVVSMLTPLARRVISRTRRLNRSRALGAMARLTSGPAVKLNPRNLPWQQWVQRPQSLWLRKVFLQVHLWVGIGIGIYVVTISISGSALVYRRELTRKFSRKPVAVAESGRRMNVEELKQHAQRGYPTYEVDNIREAQTPD